MYMHDSSSAIQETKLHLWVLCWTHSSQRWRGWVYISVNCTLCHIDCLVSTTRLTSDNTIKGWSCQCVP